MIDWVLICAYMNFLNNFKRNKNNSSSKNRCINLLPSGVNGSNLRLIELMNLYKMYPRQDIYRQIMIELDEENTYFLIPLIPNPNFDHDSYKIMQIIKDSVKELERLQVLFVYTDEESLISRVKNVNQYAKILSKDIIYAFTDYKMDRIVINSGLPNKIAIIGLTGKVHPIYAKKGVSSSVISLPQPLDPIILSKLIENFKPINFIDEMFIYGRITNGKFSINLGFRLAEYSNENENTICSVFEDILKSTRFNNVVEISFLESERGYKDICKISNSLLFRK